MHPLELSRGAHLQPDQSKNIQARTQRTLRIFKQGRRRGGRCRCYTPLPPPLPSDLTEEKPLPTTAAAHCCRLPSAAARRYRRGGRRRCRRLPFRQIWRRGGRHPCCCFPSSTRSSRGEGATQRRSRVGGRHYRSSWVWRRRRESCEKKGIRTMSSWSSRGDKDGCEWIRRGRLSSIF